MAVRAIWKGVLHLGEAEVPVKLYSAVEPAGVHFRLLHSRDGAPVRQEMVDAEEGKPVPREVVRRGLELDQGTIVIIRPEELEAIEPPASREVQIEQFVEPAGFDLRWFDRPYYLGPDGDEDLYFALVTALQNRKQVGIARWVMRKKRYQGALWERGGYLILQTMRHREELVQLEELKPARNREPDQRELALADQLVGALQAPFDIAAFRDEYRDRVMQLIEAKARGQAIKLPRPKPIPTTRSLTRALESSLRAARGEEPAARARARAGAGRASHAKKQSQQEKRRARRAAR